jgi:hypothetical protein
VSKVPVLLTTPHIKLVSFSTLHALPIMGIIYGR